MKRRVTLATMLLGMLAGSADVAQALQVPGQPSPGGGVAGQPTPISPEEAARLRLEAHLKELQRRLEFDNPDLASREQLLRAIIDDCIELGRDYAPYQAKLKEVQVELKKRADEAAKQERYQRLASKRKTDALAAMRSVPPRWSDAAAAVNDVLGLTPGDPQAVAWKATIDQKLRQQRLYRGILGSLLTLVTGGLGLAAFKALRKRNKGGAGPARRLEMIEGPQAGEVFPLEKEITTLGAVAVEADWAIADASHRISRRHCDIARSGRHYFLTDYSSNGTFVNGRRVPKGDPVLLRKGDRIGLTDEILLRFR